MTINVRTKSRSISRTNMVVCEGGMSIMINSPFIRAPRQEPPAQLLLLYGNWIYACRYSIVT